MDSDKAALYGGIAALLVCGLLTMAACLLCKFCLSSRKAQRWSGDSSSKDTKHDKAVVNSESGLAAKIQDFGGYDTMEKNVSIAKLPISVSKEGLQYDDEKREATTESEDDKLDLTKLKVVHKPRIKSHSFHNSYTIYEENSDLSGAESGAMTNGDCTPRESKAMEEATSEDGEREASLKQSYSCQSIGASLELFKLPDTDSGLGQIEYSLTYHKEKEQMVMYIMKGKELDLPCNASGGLPDTFIKAVANDCHDNDPKKQTKLCKSTVNPVFEETFIFRVSHNELSTASITLQIFTRDHYARQKLIGEISVDLSPLLVTESYRTWSNIRDYDHQPMSSCAQVKVGLSHDPSLEQTTIELLELKSLRLKSSPLYKTKSLYLTVTLETQNGDVNKKRIKTHTMLSGSHELPLDGQPLIFEHSHNDIHQSRVLIELCEEYPDGTDDTIGYTLLGNGTSDIEYGHWMLLDNVAASQPIMMWHHLHLMSSSLQHRSNLR